MSAADFAQNVFHRHRHVVQIDGRGGTALDAHLLFFGARSHARKFALHQKRGELLAIHLRKDGVKIGRATVGDPHFLAVQDVVLAIRAQVGASAGGQRVRSSLRFAQCIGSHQFRVR